MDSKFRERRLRNDPDAGWIFDRSNSIDGVESFWDLSDSVWLLGRSCRIQRARCRLAAQPTWLSTIAEAGMIYALVENSIQLFWVCSLLLFELFRCVYNRNAPRAVADFDATEFFARFQVDNGDIV